MGPVVPSAWPKVPGGTCHTPRWAWDLYGDYGGDYDFIWSYVWFYMILYDFIWPYNILMMYTTVLVGGFCDILMITQHFWSGLPSSNQTWQGEVYYYDYSLFSHWNLNLWGCYVLLNDPTPFLLQNPCLCPFMMAIPPEARSVWVGSQSYHLQWRCSEAPMHINYPDSLSTWWFTPT